MIVWSGPLEDISGYGTASRDYIKGMYEAGVDIRAFSVKYDARGSNDKFIPEQDRELYETIKIDPHSLHYINDEFKFVWHSSPNVARASRKARLNVVMTVWETDRVPEAFGDQLKNFDRVITASEFSKNSFKTTFPKLDIRVVPHILHDMYGKHFELSDNIKDYVLPKIEDKFVFLWNSEWHIGKGYDVLLNGFCDTFFECEDVVLLLKTYNLSATNYRADVINTIKKIKQEKGYEYPKIIPVIGDLAYNDVLALYELSHAFINSSRREGFSVTTAEALGFRLPIIAPDKGGHTEFLHKNNHIPVISDWVDVHGVERNRAIYKGQKWIEMDYDDFCDGLEHVYTQYDSEQRSLMPFMGTTLKKFNKENVTVKLIKELT